MRNDILAAACTNMYCDRLTDIFKIDVITYSRTENINEIQNLLNRWENEGYLQILKPIKDCANREPCIRLLKIIPLPDPDN
jgi:hypothetical protein